jgi:hypothetical protein
MASLKSREKENKKKAFKKFEEIDPTTGRMRGYDMQRDAFGPGSLVESETKLPKFFKFIPDAFQVEKFLQEKVKPKIKKKIKKKAGGRVKKVKAHRGDGIAKRGRTRGRIV